LAVYYRLAEWMIQDLKEKDWKLLEAAHYKASRVALYDYEHQISSITLDNECEKATSHKW